MADQLAEQLVTKLNYLDRTKKLIADAIEQAGASISPELSFREYADIISELSTGDVLLFDTINAMEAYENPPEDILAVIYKSEIVNIELNNNLRYLVFPVEATIPTEVTSTYTIPIRRVDGWNSIGTITITPSYISITIGNNISVEYISDDGINYTRNTELNNPVDVGQDIIIEPYYAHSIYATYFIKTLDSEFNGIFKYVSNSWTPVLNQFNLDASNQILTNYSGFGKTNVVTGDGSFISNIRTIDYINKYLPNINNNTSSFNVIQYGTPVKQMEFVQRERINIDDAFNSNDVSDCIVQTVDLTAISVNTGNNANIINNYLNCQSKKNYSFFIGDKAYRLYLGYNYSTKQQLNAFTNDYSTVPYQMTSLYAFIINLEDLSIYKTFQNNESWTFTNNGFGSLLTYAYSVQSDCLVLLTDMDGWLSTNGAYIGLTTITPDGTRTTRYFTVNYSTEYSYKSIAYTSYDNTQDCYYLALKSSQVGGSPYSIKRICKLTPSGTLSSIYESSEDMQYISSLWSSYFKNLDSIICYYTENKGSVIRNLNTNVEIQLYGSIITSSAYFGIDDNNLYIACKADDTSEYYDIYSINKNTLNMTKIYEINASSRISNCYYTYNRQLAIFYNNKIVSTTGEILNNFIPTLLSNPSISGIDDVDDYGYKASFMDYNLNITSDKFTAYVPKYIYYKYSDITNYPVSGNLCIVATSKTDTHTNLNGGVYKYQSLILTDVNYEDVDEALAITERILGNSDPSETTRYIQSLQNLIDEAQLLSSEIEGSDE